MYSGKNGSTQAKVVVFGQSGCIREKWVFSGKVVLLEQSGCIRKKVVVIGQK